MNLACSCLTDSSTAAAVMKKPFLSAEAAQTILSLLESEKRKQYDLTRTTAAMALVFIIVITPTTLMEVIYFSTGAKVSLSTPSLCKSNKLSLRESTFIPQKAQQSNFPF